MPTVEIAGTFVPPTKLSDMQDAQPALLFAETTRFKTWRKHVREMYSTMVTYERTWDSRTVEFLPSFKEVPNGLGEQTVLMGTWTGGAEQNYLELNTLTLPIGNHHLSAVSYDAETKEVGGHGLAPNDVSCKVNLRMYHDGNVVQARTMPTNSNIFATVSQNGNIYLFDKTGIARSAAPNYPERRLLPTAEWPAIDNDEKDPKKMEAQSDRLELFNGVVALQEQWDARKGPGQHKLCLDYKFNGMNSRKSLVSSSTDASATAAENDPRIQATTASVAGSGSTEQYQFGSSVGTSSSIGGITNSDQHVALSAPGRKPSSVVGGQQDGSIAVEDRSGETFKFSTLGWCNSNYGRLAAGTFDGEVSVWSVANLPNRQSNSSFFESGGNNGGTISSFPKECTFHVGGEVNEVQFHPRDNHLIACAVQRLEGYTWSRDGGRSANIPGLALCDIRTSSLDHGGVVNRGVAKSYHTPKGPDGCRSVDWCPSNSFLCVQGTHRGTVVMFDIRNTTVALAEVACHKRPTGVKARWSPHAAGVVATAGEELDSLATIVDFSAPEGEQVVFKHSGHGDGVSDIAWSPFKQYAGLVASSDMNGQAHFWKPRDEYYNPSRQDEAGYLKQAEKERTDAQREKDEIDFLTGMIDEY